MGEKKTMAPTVIKAESKTGIKPRVLVVDDEADILGIMSDAVRKDFPCKLIQAKSLGEAQHILESQPVDLLVTDVHLPDGDGTALLPLLRREQPNANAIVITGAPSIDGAIAAMRHGAIDFLSTLAEIAKTGYQGWITVELYPYIDNPDGAAREAREHLGKIAQKLDLTIDERK